MIAFLNQLTIVLFAIIAICILIYNRMIEKRISDAENMSLDLLHKINNLQDILIDTRGKVLEQQRIDKEEKDEP